MSDHNLAEALRRIANAKFGMTTADAFHLQSIARRALAAHEAEQQAGEAVARTFEDWARSRGMSPDKLDSANCWVRVAYDEARTHPQQPLTDEQIKSIYHASHWWELGNFPFTWGAAAVVIREAERAHGIGITKDTK